jgi:hypothetical protein
MPPSTGQRIASALLAPAGVLLMFEAVPFRRYRVELSGLPDRGQRLRAGTGRCPRGGRPPGVFAASGVADSCKRAVRPLTRRTSVAAVAGVVHYVVCVRVNESWLGVWPLRRPVVRAEVVA